MPDYTISIDCAPGTPRPDTYINDVIAGTGLPQENLDQLIISKCFGNWTWQFKDIPEEIWLKAQPLIATRIKGLYEIDQIRYGEWSARGTPPYDERARR